jgi:hypothetical protein
MIIARQSTARTVTVGPMLDAAGAFVSDGVVADFKISKNGGAPAALNASATLTHRNTGHYSLALTASDLDTVGQAEIVIDDTVNGCPIKEITVVEEAVYDALFAASANAWSGAAGSSIGVANVTQIGGDAQSATDLKDFADAGYDPATNKVEGVKLADTLTTYTGNTPQTGDAYAIVNSGTHGNAALKTLIDAVDNFIDTEIGDIQSRLPAALTGAGNMKVDVLAWLGTAPATPTVAGVPEVDVTHFGGTAGAFTFGIPSINVQLWAGSSVSLSDDLHPLVDIDSLALQAKADIRSALGMASANLDTQLGDIPTNAEFEARTLVAANYATAANQTTIIGYLDTEIAAILAAVDTEIAAIKAKTDNLPASPAATGDAMTLTSGERDAVAAALLDLAAGIETNRTLRQAMRLILATAVGKLSGAATNTVAIRDTNDTKDRVTATVDGDGNRSVVTLDAS